MVYVISGIVVGVVCTIIGYHFGKKNGIQLGMQQFLSIMKVYDDSDHTVMNGINKTLNKAASLSENERWMKIEEYVKSNNL